MFSQRWHYMLALSVMGFLLFSQTSALTVEYCSSLNTASMGKNSSIYQSNGLCHDFCVSDYAFAILQYDGCWCSNYAPASTTTGCDLGCPGYPDDKCGGIRLYGYIQLKIQPLGTKGASSSAVGATTSSTTTPPPQSTTVSTTSLETTSSSLSTWTPTPVTSVYTITGAVHTITTTPTAPPSSGNAAGVVGAGESKGGGKGLNTAQGVGLAVGVVSFILTIAAACFFLLMRKKRQAQEQQANHGYIDSRHGSTAGMREGGPGRTTSQNSRYVLNTDGRQVIEAWEPGDAPERRQSRLVPVDPRLDPYSSVYQRDLNKSRDSINTIRDEHDYSRRVVTGGPILRATNPDP